MNEKQAQVEKFKRATRELGADKDEAHFKAALRKIARADVPPEQRKKAKRKKRSTKSAD